MANEGTEKTAYKDEKGIWTIGQGYRLDGPNKEVAIKELKELGYNYDDVINKKVSLKPSDIEYLTNKSLERASRDAAKAVTNWDSLETNVKEVLTEMAYQLGAKGLKDMKNFIIAINKGDYTTAIKEMRDSDWYRKDSPKRVEKLIQKLKI